MKNFIERLFPAPDDSFFIFGPRGTGKSTWLKKAYPDAYLIDLLDDEIFRNHVAHPERIVQIVKANPGTLRFIIDEVQKAPALLDSIHRLIQENKTLQFIMTGSSARKLRRGGVNLLAGRALLTHFHPFMAMESIISTQWKLRMRNKFIPKVSDRSRLFAMTIRKPVLCCYIAEPKSSWLMEFSAARLKSFFFK